MEGMTMKAQEVKTSVELCGERYMALYEQMMVPWRFEKWCADLASIWMPTISVEVSAAE